MVQPTDFNILEKVKENIEPLEEGRSATALARIFSAPTTELKQSQIEERNQFELAINNCEDLDDPLEPYISYIKWINNNFPQGPTVSNGLVSVLERCTSYFKDYAIYKNDPRYLRIWLSYAKYSENPLNVFVFLYRKQIGELLALYYEEYAKLLELNNGFEQANQVYQRGLLVEARPVRRLQLRYNEFRQRMNNHMHTLEAHDNNENNDIDPFPKRTALSIKGGSVLADHPEEDEEGEGEEEEERHQETQRGQEMQPIIPSIARSEEKKKTKLSIYVDPEEQQISSSNALFTKVGGWDDFGSIASRTKENKLAAKPWVGETLKQHTGSAPDTKKLAEKVRVFRDNHDDADVPAYKIVENPGKNTEKLDINLDLLYESVDGEEYCLNEVLALMKGNYGFKKRSKSTNINKENDEIGVVSNTSRKENEQEEIEIDEDNLMNKLGQENPLGIEPSGAFGSFADIGNDSEIDLDNHCEEPPLPIQQRLSNFKNNSIENNSLTKTTTTTVKLNDLENSKPNWGKTTLNADTSAEIHKSPTVTMTMFTKEANNEVHSMFNQKVNANISLGNFADKSSQNCSDFDENNFDEYTEHTNHKDLLLKLQKENTEKKQQQQQQQQQQQYKQNLKSESLADHKDHGDIDQLGDEVAELSVIEPDDEDGNEQSINKQVRGSSLETNPFLLSPIKHPLLPSSSPVRSASIRQGSPLKFSLLNVDYHFKSPSKFQLPLSPSKQIESNNVCNPFDLKLKQALLSNLNPGIDTYPHFFKYNEKKDNLKYLKSACSKNKQGNVFVSFGKAENEIFHIKKELGVGGYGVVYLAELSVDGSLNAIKVENPANAWEFYIIRAVRDRLKTKASSTSSQQKQETITKIANFSIVEAKLLHLYKDESYLILNYENQGTILDAINLNRSAALTTRPEEALNEVLAAFLTIEALKIVENLHDIGIIHGDLKADNCMMKLKNSNSGTQSQQQSFGNKFSSLNEAKQFLSDKGISLIDYGRAIDLKLLSNGTRFKAELDKVDSQDCPEIQQNKEWTYEVDYYGLANIIHTMLFGKYITVHFNSNTNCYQLNSKLKRYWQTNLWDPLISFLLNPKQYGEMPNNNQLRKHRARFENWLFDESNGMKNMNSLKKNIFELQENLRKVF